MSYHLNYNWQSGHTLLEVMIAVAIFGAVLIPMAVLFQNYLVRSSNTELLVNHQLARSMMENILANHDYNDSDTTIQIGSKSYHVTVNCSMNNSLERLLIRSEGYSSRARPVILERDVYVAENK